MVVVGKLDFFTFHFRILTLSAIVLLMGAVITMKGKGDPIPHPRFGGRGTI